MTFQRMPLICHSQCTVCFKRAARERTLGVLPSSLSAVDLDWINNPARKMGDDLGDEWWEHEGKSGISCDIIIFLLKVFL